MSPKLRRALPLALAGLLAGLACVELGLRHLAGVGRAFHVWPPGKTVLFHPAPGVLPGVEGSARLSINAAGWRGDPDPGGAVYRVLALGGSTTECLYLDHDEAWPQRVQQLLGPGAWVPNAGVSGRNTRDHVVQLRHLLPQHPELDAVLLLVGINDLLLRLSQGDDYDPRFLETEGAEERLLERVFARLPLHAVPGAWWERTALGRTWALRAKREQETGPVQDAAGKRFGYWRKLRKRARKLEQAPDLGPALEEYRRNLVRLVNTCREHGVRPVLLTQPALWRPGLPRQAAELCWMGWVGESMETPGAPFYALDVLYEALAQYNEVLRAVAVELRVEYVELAGELDGRTEYFYDDVHFTERGARRVAELVAEYLGQRAPFGG